jgi:hypothetical protein
LTIACPVGVRVACNSEDFLDEVLPGPRSVI